MLPEILDLHSYRNYSVYRALGPALNRTNKAPALRAYALVYAFPMGRGEDTA